MQRERERENEKTRGRDAQREDERMRKREGGRYLLFLFANSRMSPTSRSRTMRLIAL